MFLNKTNIPQLIVRHPVRLEVVSYKGCAKPSQWTDGGSWQQQGHGHEGHFGQLHLDSPGAVLWLEMLAAIFCCGTLPGSCRIAPWIWGLLLKTQISCWFTDFTGMKQLYRWPYMWICFTICGSWCRNLIVVSKMLKGIVYGIYMYDNWMYCCVLSFACV